MKPFVMDNIFKIYGFVYVLTFLMDSLPLGDNEFSSGLLIPKRQTMSKRKVKDKSNRY